MLLSITYNLEIMNNTWLIYTQAKMVYLKGDFLINFEKIIL